MSIENPFDGNGFNSKDPLTKLNPGRKLFDTLRDQCRGVPGNYVIDAAMMIVLHVMREAIDNRPLAERQADEIFGRAKMLLLDHYDSVTGRRRSGLYPFPQGINPSRMDDKDGFSEPSAKKN